MILKETKVGVIAYHDELVSEFLGRSDIKYKYDVLAVEPQRVAMVCVMKRGTNRYTAVGEATPANCVKESQKDFLFTLAADRAFDHAMIALLGLGRNVKSNLDVKMSPSLLKAKTEEAEEESTSAEPVVARDPSPAPALPSAPATEGADTPAHVPVEEALAPATGGSAEARSVFDDILPPAAAQESEPATADALELTDETVILVGQLKGKKVGQLRNDGRLPNLIRWAHTSRISYPEGSPEAAQLAALRKLEYSPQ